MMKPWRAVIALWAMASCAGAWAQVGLSASVGVIGGLVGSSGGLQGYPYTATRKTTTIEKLADGTTITHESLTREARDSAGRTMHEIKPQGVNSRVVPEIVLVTVIDPVSRVTLSWTNRSKQATLFRMPDPQTRPPVRPANGNPASGAGGPAVPPGTAPVPVLVAPRAPAVAGQGEVAKTPASTSKDSLRPQIHRETLPGKTIHGVYAEGVRTTITTPTGLVGNDRPLVSVQEVWQSPELKIVVSENSEDERGRLRIVELTDLERVDPDPSLFQVPEGYTVKEQERPQ